MATPQLQLLGVLGKGDTRIRVFGNIQKLKKDLKRMSNVGIGRAFMRATNKAGNQTRTFVRARIAKRHNLPIKLVGSYMSTRKANRRVATYRLNAKGPRIPLAKVKGFSGFASQKTLGVGINTGTGRRIIKGAFIVRTDTGHVGVFKRKQPEIKPRLPKPGKGGTPIYPELKIRELSFPSVAHMLVNKKVSNAAFRFYENKFLPIFGQQLQNEIRKAQGF